MLTKQGEQRGKKKGKYLHIKVQEYGAGNEMKIKNFPLYIPHTLRVHKNGTTQKHTSC
jgi:hypothetical protein